MGYESKKYYYLSAESMEADGFVDGRRSSWSGAWGAITDFAELVPTIGELPDDSAWELSEYFSHTADRFFVGGIKTPDLYISIYEPIVKMRREFKVQDGEKPYYTPNRPLTPDEEFRIAGVITRLLEEKERKTQRQREMVARINADEYSEEDILPF